MRFRDLQRHRVAGVARGASIQRRALALGRHVRRHAGFAAAPDEVSRVVRLVGADRGPAPALAADHAQGRFTLGRTGGRCGVDIDDQAVAVLHQHMGHVHQACPMTRRLAKQSRIRVARRGVGVVDPALALEIHLRVAPGSRRWPAAIPGPKTLMRSPSVDQRAIDAEVLVAGQRAPLGEHPHPLEKRPAPVLR